MNNYSFCESYKDIIMLIGNSVCQLPLPSDYKVANEASLFQLSKKHEVAQIVGMAIETNDLIVSEDQASRFKKQYYLAVRQIVVLDEETDKIKRLLESENIEFCILKGPSIRTLYGEQWMRLSSDIDILIKKMNLEKVRQLLKDNLHYQSSKGNTYHDSMVSSQGLHVEIHYTLANHNCDQKEILERVWDYCEPIAPDRTEYVMKDEFLYFYHVFHMAKHFRNGGCGIRSILDTWMLNHRISFDSNKRQELLKEGNLQLFENSIEKIAEEWFSKGKCEINTDVEKYICSGGVFGDNQRVAAMQAVEGNRKRYIVKRVFPPIALLRGQYPVLRKCPILLPFCWVHRLISGTYKGKTRKELQKSRQSRTHSTDLSDLFKSVGLL